MSKELKNLDRKDFDLNQKKIYAEVNRNGIRSNDVLNAKECKKFWSNF